MDANALSQRLFGSSKEEDLKGAPKSEELVYSFEAIDFLDDETKRLYRLWLDVAIGHTRAGGRNSVTLDDVKATMNDALEKLLDAKR